MRWPDPGALIFSGSCWCLLFIHSATVWTHSTSGPSSSGTQHHCVGHRDALYPCPCGLLHGVGRQASKINITCSWMQDIASLPAHEQPFRLNYFVQTLVWILLCFWRHLLLKMGMWNWITFRAGLIFIRKESVWGTQITVLCFSILNILYSLMMNTHLNKYKLQTQPPLNRDLLMCGEMDVWVGCLDLADVCRSFNCTVLCLFCQSCLTVWRPHGL